MVARLVQHVAQVGLSLPYGAASLQSLRPEQPRLPSGENTVCHVPGELPCLWLHLRAVV